MAVVLLGAVRQYIGLSSDTKPTDAPAGSEFLESDTKNLYVYTGSAWSLKKNESGEFVAFKTITLDGSASYDIFTITGAVGAKLCGYIKTILTNHADTVSVGTATSNILFIAATAGTAMQTASEIWKDNDPSKGELTMFANYTGVSEKITLYGTANITGGVIEFMIRWIPMSSDGLLVPA